MTKLDNTDLDLVELGGDAAVLLLRLLPLRDDLLQVLLRVLDLGRQLLLELLKPSGLQPGLEGKPHGPPKPLFSCAVNRYLVLDNYLDITI